MDAFILVHLSCDEVEILDIGNRTEIVNSYYGAVNEINSITRKYGESPYSKTERDFSSDDEYNKYMEDVIFSEYDNMFVEKLCIMGKVDGVVKCVCKDFECVNK